MAVNDATVDDMSDLVGFKIRDIGLYQCAFTHRSGVRASVSDVSYETMEFMGDSVLSFIITKYLYDRYKDDQEGFMTRARTRLVRGKTLTAVAEHMGLDRYVLMDDKGMTLGWQRNPKVMEDVFEALVGAVYMDAGLIYARTFVLGAFERCGMFDESFIRADDNYKDALMRACQNKHIDQAVYASSRDASGTFHVAAHILGRFVGEGRGKTKRDAEQMAARRAIENWDSLNIGCIPKLRNL